MTLEDALVEALRPLVQRLVREEVKRAQAELRWVPAARAAELLDLSVEAVQTRVRRGQLPGRNLNGKVLVDMEALRKQLERPIP